MKKLVILFAIALIAFSALAQDVTVNISKSELKWTGKKVTGEHWGFIKLKNATLTIENDIISSGEFNIDMNSINCKDLEDAEWNGKLVGHLKSDDFFSVEKFPVATLIILKSKAFKNGEAEVKGNLTIKGITHPTLFKVRKSDNGYTATISVDRTKYNVKYGSGKFFDNLGDNMIYDEFTLEVKIIAI